MGAITLQSLTQAQIEVRRITNELVDLQRQVASGAAAYDLQGLGSGSSRLLNARAMLASTDSRASVITQLQARFGVQGAALGQVSDASTSLAQSIREAISANDGRGVGTELELSFASIVSALNQTWNGQPMFAGERQGGAPVKVQTLDELITATAPEALYDEAARHQEVDLGAGAPIIVAAKASELSQGIFDALRQLKILIDARGGALGQPISGADRDTLLQLAATFEAEATHFTNEEGRVGQLQKRFETESERLTNRSNLLLKEVGEQADADVGEATIKLSALLTQYEAAAKTFSELSKLSLLNYL